MPGLQPAGAADGAAAVMRELAVELVTTFQVCPGFNPAR